MFRNAIDIMLLRSETKQEAPLNTDLNSTRPPPRRQEEKGWLNKDFFSKIFSLKAKDAHAKTKAQIRIHAEKLIREEAAEILEKALLSIQEAIENEQFKAELGGPGRTETGRYVLKQAYSQYREDSRKYICEYLRAEGYQIKEVENVYLKIDWSQANIQQKPAPKIEEFGNAEKTENAEAAIAS